MTTENALWERYKATLYTCSDLGLSLDSSRMNWRDDFFDKLAVAMERAYTAMEALEGGAVANPDEGRMVGHYWLRDPKLAPCKEIQVAIEAMRRQVREFTENVHEARVTPEKADRFENLLVVGIGGSALGPQLATAALGSSRDRMRLYFFDNTDPDGFDSTVAAIERDSGLSQTLTAVISKSGGTKETRNGMLEIAEAYRSAGLDFSQHAIAVTGRGSELDRLASRDGWIETFPMWDWVGGRTSELCAVGLLPASLQGIDVEALLEGAARMDRETRNRDTRQNPAALLALMWYYATGGRGDRDMIVLPYKDRLVLFSKYLQQLIMESLGKEFDLDGNPVLQGLAVYGNKGSTDQHAYVQQLREGVNNFFVTFIEVLRDREGDSIEVEPGVTSGDYLHGFFLGTRQALHDNGRESITLTIRELDARCLGALIALFERAVGFYATLVNINAYHQPGVEAGKKAAGAVIELECKLLAALRGSRGSFKTAEDIVVGLGCPERVETAYRILEHLASNPGRGVARRQAASPWDAAFGIDV